MYRHAAESLTGFAGIRRRARTMPDIEKLAIADLVQPIYFAGSSRQGLCVLCVMVGYVKARRAVANSAKAGVCALGATRP